jgi:bifunctional non-homologous end joining protein LigD
MLWDEGYWSPQTDVENGLRAGSLKFALNGKRLKGNWTLVRMSPKNGETDDNWLLIKEKDDFAQSGIGIGAYDTSVRTGLTMKAIEMQANEKKTKNPFSETGVQLAKLTDKAPDGDGWLYELKYDGYRIVAFIEEGAARLMTRNANDATDRFCSIAADLQEWAGRRAMVLDGEIAVADESGGLISRRCKTTCAGRARKR